MQNADQDQKERSVKVSGKTVQDAIDLGLAQLDLSEDQVEIEVIKEGSRGILGFGAEDAVVQLTAKSALPTTSIDSSSESMAAGSVATNGNEADTTYTEADDSESASSVEGDDPAAVAEVTAPVASDKLDIEARAQEVLSTLLEKMSINAEVSVRVGEDLVESDEAPPLTLDITGSDLGVLIGRRGETLRSLQFVVRQILSKEAGHWVPVIVDVESYLVRRRKSLQQLAQRMADRVAFSKRKVTLEPMSAQERRIIHIHLREHVDIYTQSIGEGERRKVVIYPKQQ